MKQVYQVELNTSSLKPFIMHLKAHKVMQKGCFFFHYSLATLMTNWVQMFTDCYFMYLCLNTPSDSTGLWQLPNVSSAFKYNVSFDSSGLFIIDDKGNLRQITINDLPVGRSVDETLRLVQAFQFTDKHGEGNCCSSFLFMRTVVYNTQIRNWPMWS